VLEYHLKVLKESLAILYDIKNELKKKYGKINEEAYEEIRYLDIKSLDTLAYRFSKIQSLLGEKVFKEILEELEYDLANKSYIDILEYIEKEGIIESIFEWKRLREIRNSLSHDYPEEITYIVKAINEMLNSIEKFDKIIKRIEEKYEYANKIKQTRD
jgi:archaellum component FlaC